MAGGTGREAGKCSASWTKLRLKFSGLGVVTFTADKGVGALIRVRNAARAECFDRPRIIRRLDSSKNMGCSQLRTTYVLGD
jgi:hypothetical protein